jgi:hypothetical protein
MAAVTFTEAAAALGFKSRSTLYRLRDEDQLRGYLVRPVRPGLAYRLETAPVGLPTLQEHVSRCIRPQATNDYGARHGIAPAPKDPRWQAVAAWFADATDLVLTPEQVEEIASHLPDALYQGWDDAGLNGEDGLEWMRQTMAEAGCWWIGPCLPREHRTPGAEARYWQTAGRWEPDGYPITDMFVDSYMNYDHPSDGDLWQMVAKMTQSHTEVDPEQLTARNVYELFEAITRALYEIRRGARWDQARWDERLAAGGSAPDLGDRDREDTRE